MRTKAVWAVSIVAMCTAMAIGQTDYQHITQNGVVTLDYRFEGTTSQGWTAGYTDYFAGMEPTIQFSATIAPLGSPLLGRGIRLSSNNASDDVWMYISRQLTTSNGISPNKLYDVAITVWVASNAQTGCAGIGGAPGESVYLKAGAVNMPPLKLQNSEQFYYFSIDKGAQSNIGSEAFGLGNLANGDSCDNNEPKPYRLLQRVGSTTTSVRATVDGKLWLYVGTDSGYEGITTMFIDRVLVTLSPRKG